MKISSEIVLRNWTENDFQAIRKILAATWNDTYSFIPKSDLISHLENYYSINKLKELISNSKVIGILAEVDHNPVGWMKLFTDETTKRFYVSSLYVIPKFQGAGIGKKLLIKAEEIANELKFDRIWLGVMKENEKALQWYKKIGFEFIEEEPFKMGTTEVLHLIGYKIITAV